MAAAWRTFLFLLVLGIAPADAQDPGTLNPEPLPPLQDPNSPKIPAKELFARKTTPLPGLRNRMGRMPMAVLPARLHYQSRDRSGKSCAYHAIAIGEIRASWPLLSGSLIAGRESDGTGS
jgi:hypothetical protein